MSSRSPHNGHWRWTPALGIVLWLVGFELMPFIHVAFHGAFGEHHHGVQHEHVTHQHAPRHHHEGDGGNHDDGDDDHGPPSQHGKGSVAHFDIAVNVPLACIPAIQEALLTWGDPLFRAHEERPADQQPQTTRARAPPGPAV